MISRVTSWEMFKHMDGDSNTAPLAGACARPRADKQMMTPSDRHMDRSWGREHDFSLPSTAWPGRPFNWEPGFEPP